jgi:hypothetical protein
LKNVEDKANPTSLNVPADSASPINSSVVEATEQNDATEAVWVIYFPNIIKKHSALFVFEFPAF